MSTPAPFPKIDAAIRREADRLARSGDAADSVVALSELIAFLQEQLTAVTVRRDELLVELLAETPSHRRLAAQLGLSRQRVDQLAKLARGGRS